MVSQAMTIEEDLGTVFQCKVKALFIWSDYIVEDHRFIRPSNRNPQRK